MNPRVPLALGALLAMAGCGSAAAVSAPSVNSAAPTSVTPSPTVAPSPAPPPPLAVLAQVNGDVDVVDVSGQTQWSLTTAAMKKSLSLGPNDQVEFQPAGGNLLLFGYHSSATTPTAGGVSVLDHGGKAIGSGVFDAGALCCDVKADPNGTQWAWSVDDTPPAASGPHHGRILVAGMGTPKHSVYSWVAPVGDTERVGAWTDMGIVMERLSFGGCGPGFHPDTASFLIDPISGTLTDLFTGDRYLDARHNVRVALAAKSASDVIINGGQYDQSGTIVDGAYVSPDGTMVGVARETPSACAGANQPPPLHTELITVADNARVDLGDCGIAGWFDTTHYACRGSVGSTVSIRDVSGNAGASLGTGTFLGVLLASP